MPLDIVELNQMEKLARDEFAGAFKQTPTNYQLFTNEITETETLSLFEFLGGFPQLREWVGARHVEELKNYNYLIHVKDWELTVLVKYKKAWDRSKTVLSQHMKGQIANLGSTFRKQWPSKKVIEAIEGGTVNLAYDGVAFFSNPSGNRVFDNLLAGTGITLDKVKADYASARAAMARFPDDHGTPLNIVGSVALIPPELESVFKELTKSQVIEGTTNVNYGSLNVVVDARLTDANDWYLLAGEEFIKPVIVVNSGGVNVQVKDETFDSKSVKVGADVSGNVGYSFPQLACKIVNS